MARAPDFEALYRAHPDPWQVATSWYERRKRQVALACLPRESYRSAWDAACGTGALAVDLAARCDRVTATDGSASAVQIAAAALAGHSNASAEVLVLPPGSGRGVVGADLIVLSEVLYYLSAASRREVVDTVAGAAAPACDVLLVHWAQRPHDGCADGREVNAEAVERLAALGWLRAVAHCDDGFVADVLTRGA